MGQFDRQIKTVNRLIAKYGRNVEFKRIPNTIPDPTKPWLVVNSEPLIATIKMVFLAPNSTGLSKLGEEILQYLGGTQTAKGVIRGYCAPFEYIPKMNDFFTTPDGQMTVKGVDTLAPNGQAIMHTVEFNL